MSEIVNKIKGFGTHYFKEKDFAKAEKKYKKALRLRDLASALFVTRTLRLIMKFFFAGIRR